jgi:glyoxylate utilization-related uncharacterized protein
MNDMPLGVAAANAAFTLSGKVNVRSYDGTHVLNTGVHMYLKPSGSSVL